MLNIKRGNLLTDREIEIASWLLRGYTTKEVARILSISQRTVDTHVNNIRLKLRSKNRIHMAAQLLVGDLVLLTPEDLDEISGFGVSGI